MIRQYEVGKDITQERYDDILKALTEWFKSYRPKADPDESARHALDCCLRGVKLSDGQTPWSTLAQSTLASRIKAATRFDIDTMQPVPARGRVAKTQNQSLRLTDPTYGNRNRKKPEDVVYGDNPASLYTPQELKRRSTLRDAYINEFPQLDNVASMAKLEMMLDLILLMDRLRVRVGKDVRHEDIEEQLTKITKQLVELEKALNIHADQLAKQQREKEGGTIGEAVRRYEEEVPAELRERWFAEELIMLYQMYHQKSPRTNMGGYQLDEVGLFGVTRCRTCACSSCGQRNFAGLSIDEIEEYLVEKGHIVPVKLERAQPTRTDAEDQTMDEESEGDPEHTAAS